MQFKPHFHLVAQVDDLGGGDVAMSAPLATREAAEAYRGGWQAAINLAVGLLLDQAADGEAEATKTMLGAITPVIVTALTQCNLCEHPDEHHLEPTEVLAAFDTSPMGKGGAVPHPDECPHCQRAFGYCDYHGATGRTKTL